MMESSLRLVRTVRLVLMASIVFYAAVAGWLRPYASPKTQTYFYVIAGLAAWAVEGIFSFRRKFLKPSEEILATKPDDVVALRRWRAASIVTYALCDAIALYGLLLRVLGFSWLLAMPFFVTGLVLMLYFAPRRPSNAIG